MRNQQKKPSSSARTAVCGILAALSASFMILSLVPGAEYAVPAFCGVLFIAAVIEINVAAGWMCYAVTALLIIILPGNIESRLLFILFFGYYPVAKASVERLFFRVARHIGKRGARAAEYAVKSVIFNAAVTSAYALLTAAFGFDTDSLAIGGFKLTWALLLAGNAVFFLYDFALTRVAAGYITIIHPHVARFLK